MENVIARRELHIERKYLVIELRENERGRFLKICETSAGRRNTVIVPATGLAEFARALASVLETTANVRPEDGQTQEAVMPEVVSDRKQSSNGAVDLEREPKE